MRRSCAALVGLNALAANADLVQEGVLKCNVEPGFGFILGSSKVVSCVFRPARGRPEYYSGRINLIGVDIGLTGLGQLSWRVFKSGPPVRRYALAGDYTGSGAGGVLGEGPGAYPLSRGEDKSISLKPLPGKSTGLNFYAGVAALTLQAADEPPTEAPPGTGLQTPQPTP